MYLVIIIYVRIIICFIRLFNPTYGWHFLISIYITLRKQENKYEQILILLHNLCRNNYFYSGINISHFDSYVGFFFYMYVEFKLAVQLIVININFLYYLGIVPLIMSNIFCNQFICT